MRTLILLFTLALVACENDLEKVNRITSNKDVSKEFAKKVEILYSEKGVVHYRILGDRLIRNDNEEDPYIEFPDNVELFIYNDSMQVESRLTGGYGISYQKTRRMIVRDSVVLWNMKGEMLNTEELIWDEAEGTISSTKFVKITTPKEIIFGDGFEANEDFSEYRIKKIRGTISIDDVNDARRKAGFGCEFANAKGG